MGLFAANQTILILKALRPISLVSRCSGLKVIHLQIVLFDFIFCFSMQVFFGSLIWIFVRCCCSGSVSFLSFSRLARRSIAVINFWARFLHEPRLLYTQHYQFRFFFHLFIFSLLLFWFSCVWALAFSSLPIVIDICFVSSEFPFHLLFPFVFIVN